MKKLTASAAQADGIFGWSVVVSGDSPVVGAYYEDAGGSNAGAAYVFEQPPPTPTPTPTNTPTSTPTPGLVGGIAELPDVEGTPLETPSSSGPKAGLLAGVAAVAAAGVVGLGGTAWYVRRRITG